MDQGRFSTFPEIPLILNCETHYCSYTLLYVSILLSSILYVKSRLQ